MASCRTDRPRPCPKRRRARRSRSTTVIAPEAPRPAPLPDHLSYSALKQLQTCPLQYRLERVDRAPPEHRSPGLLLGAAYHRVLAHALRSVKESGAEAHGLTREALLLWFDDLWAEELDAAGPPVLWSERTTPENQRDLGRAMVAAWHAKGLPLFAEAKAVLAVEEPFCVELVRSDGRRLRTPLAGVIDAIVLRRDDTVVVVDHKTARQAYAESYLELDLQAAAYTYAAGRLGRERPAFEFHVASKRKAPELSVVPVTCGPDSFDRLFWVASQAERLVESGVYLPAAPTWLCDSCDVRNACAGAHRAAAASDGALAVAS